MFVATSYIPTFIQFRKHAVHFLKNLNQILLNTKKQGAKIQTAYLPHTTHTSHPSRNRILYRKYKLNLSAFRCFNFNGDWFLIKIDSVIVIDVYM